jgi:hypothetical protein
MTAPTLELPDGLVLQDDERNGMLATAVMDKAGTYRYLLTRIWDTSVPPMTLIMLNPSTADALADDATIRRLAGKNGFARREACGGIVVVNLFALRSTSPKALDKHKDPIGWHNDLFVARAAREAKMVVAGWGAMGVLHDRGQVVAAALQTARIPVRCFGVTATGQPRHPLYLPLDAPLVDYAPAAVAA